MNKLIDFYVKVLESFKLSIKGDMVYIGSEQVLINGKPLVLPTKPMVDDLMEADEHGRFVATKYLFNPLNESAMRDETQEFRKLKTVSDINLSLLFGFIGRNVLVLLHDKAKTQAPNELIGFANEIKSLRIKGVKDIIDDRTIQIWDKFIDEFVTGHTKFLRLYTKKGIQYEADKYFRGIIVGTQVLDKLDDMKDEYKLRNKDLGVFKALYNFILGELLEDRVVAVSNDENAPAFISLIKGYKKTAEELMEHMEYISGVDADSEALSMINISYDYKDVSETSNFRNSVITIPTMNDDGTINEVETAPVAEAPHHTGMRAPRITLPDQPAPVSNRKQPQHQQQTAADPDDELALFRERETQQYGMFVGNTNGGMSGQANMSGSMIQPMGYQQPVGYPQPMMGQPNGGMMYPQQPQMGYGQQAYPVPNMTQQPQMGYQQQGYMPDPSMGGMYPPPR
jgi:hypothetical protein